MEAENPPTIVASRSCRSDKKLVEFIIENRMQLVESMGPFAFTGFNVKSNNYALWLFHYHDGERTCNWSNHSVNLNNTNRERRCLEQLNMIIAYGVPNSYDLKQAYVCRALLAYNSEQDFYCLYNIWQSEDANAKIDFSDTSLRRECEILHEKARTRRLGEIYPSPFEERKLPECISYAMCKESVKYGRYLQSKSNLAEKSLVVRELPFMRLLLNANCWMRCHYCLIYAPFVLIPCPGCTAALYCSQTCLRRAHQEYHSLECAMMFYLQSQYTPIQHLALRLTIRVYKIFYEMPDVLDSYIRKLSTLDAPMHQYNIPYGAGNNDMEAAYKKVYQLATNRRHVTREALTTNGLKGVALAEKLVSVHRLPASCVGLLAELTVRHMHILRTNTLMLNCSVDDPAKDCFDATSVPYALALMTTGSMFNHSCKANVNYTLSTGGMIEFKTNQNIRWGSQLCINYRCNPKDERYSFECYCRKCRICV